MGRFIAIVLLSMSFLAVNAKQKVSYEQMKCDSIVAYKLKGSMVQSGAVDFFWKKKEVYFSFLQNFEPRYLDSLLKIVGGTSNYEKNIEWTPRFNIALVFFYKGEKVGHMCFDFTQWDGGSVRYSHYVPAFEKGTVDMTDRQGGVYYTPLSEKGIERVRKYFLFAGFSDTSMVALKGHPPVRP